MSEAVRILGVDPGFANLGLCAYTYSSGAEEVNAVSVVTTKPSPKKQRIHQHDDEHRRLEEIERAFIAFLEAFKPDLIATETFPSLRSAPATRKVALVYGALHALARDRDIPWRSYSGQEIKCDLTGKRTSSKEEVFTAVKARVHFAGWPATKKVEHVADACGAAMTARHDHLVGLLLRERRNAVDRLVELEE